MVACRKNIRYTALIRSGVVFSKFRLSAQTAAGIAAAGGMYSDTSPHSTFAPRREIGRVFSWPNHVFCVSVLLAGLMQWPMS